MLTISRRLFFSMKCETEAWSFLFIFDKGKKSFHQEKGKSTCMFVDGEGFFFSFGRGRPCGSR